MTLRGSPEASGWTSTPNPQGHDNDEEIESNHFAADADAHVGTHRDVGRPDELRKVHDALEDTLPVEVDDSVDILSIRYPIS